MIFIANKTNDVKNSPGHNLENCFEHLEDSSSDKFSFNNALNSYDS